MRKPLEQDLGWIMFVFMMKSIIIKMNKNLTFFILLVHLIFPFATGLSKEERPPYQYPTETEVLQSIKDWQDLKFGLFMHWGPYSQWGIVESWSLCPEDRPFTSVRPEGKSYFEYVKNYENLKLIFFMTNQTKG